MDPSSSDLEFFDFKNSSDEEIKEIQAILKGPGSNGCVELPWEIFVKNNCTGSLSQNEGAALEIDPESIKSSKNVAETTEQTLSFVPPQTLLPPVAQLPPPAAEAFVSLPATVGPYQNAPYFVSRSIPYLRGYPPMGVPFFACPMPGTGEANPYGQFVPMVPERPIDSEPSLKSRDRQSNRRSSKKRLSEGSENVNVYPEVSSTTCPTSIPLVPLPVPPSTFVGGNMPMHGYPPGLPSPAMYYVPVFNHPYGGYLSPSGPPMMLPVNVATELKCSLHGSEEMLQTDNGGLEETLQANGGGSPHTASSVGCESPRISSNGSFKESPRTVSSGSPCESPQTASNGGLKESLQTDHGVIPANSCIDESLPTDNGSSEKVLQTLNSPIKETTPNVQSDCKVSISPDTVNTQPVHPTAKADVPESEERTDSLDSLSGPLNEGSCSMNRFQETEKCLKETIPLAETVTPKATVPTEARETDPLKVPLAEMLKTVPTEAKDCRPATEKVKQVVRDQSRCWADLFKGPSREVNGFEAPPPKQRHDKKSTLNNSKRDIANGKVYSVPASNSLH